MHLYTQTLLHTNIFTPKHSNTQTRLHTNTFYTQKLLHTIRFNKWKFTYNHLYTPTSLHRNTRTHKPVYTQRLWHTEGFTHNTFTQMHLYTQTLLHPCLLQPHVFCFQLPECQVWFEILCDGYLLTYHVNLIMIFHHIHSYLSLLH